METNRTKYKNDYAKTHYKRIPLDLQFWEYEKWKDYANSKGLPFNSFIKQAVRHAIDSNFDFHEDS